MKLSEWVYLPIRLLLQVTGFCSFEGDWWLRDYEKQLIDIARANLSPSNRAILDQQLKMWFFVDRRGKSTKIYHQFHSKVPAMKLAEESWRQNLGRIYIESEGGKCKVSVVADHGQLFYLEFSAPPKKVFKHPFKVLKTEFGGPVDMSAAMEEHDEEHGDTMPFKEYIKQFNEHNKK